MNIIFNTVFIKKENWNYLQIFNYFYWSILIGKNILKWIFASSLDTDTNIKPVLLIILSLNTLLRLCFIGIGSIHKFRKSFKNNIALVFIIFIGNYLFINSNN